MNLFIILFLASLLLGQLGGISIFPGVVVYVHDIILVLLLVLSIRKIRRVKLTVPIAAFIGAGVVSLLVNLWRFPLPELGLGSLYLVRWALYAALYVCVVRNNLNVWCKGLYAVGVGFGILGLMQFFLYPDLRNLVYLGWDPHEYRLFSTLLDPNFMGIILVFTLLLGVSFFSKKNRLWIIAGEFIAFISLLLTYSRSSYLALATAIIVLAFMKKQWKLFGILTAFIVLILVLSNISGNTVKILRVDSTIARVANWQESLTLIVKAPVFGFGFDTLRYVRPTDSISKAAAGLDSSILFILATTGVVGLITYAFLFVSMIRLAHGRLRQIFVASLSALLVHSFFVNSIFYPWVMIWMWILTGTVTCDT